MQFGAAKMASEAPGQTLQATALVHEAWMRVRGGEGAAWDGRAHFFGAAANAMRNILVDQARRRSAQKRDAHKRADLPDALPDLELSPEPTDILALHDALLRAR